MASGELPQTHWAGETVEISDRADEAPNRPHFREMEERDESRISLSGPTGPMADGSHLGPKASEAPADIQQVPLVRRSPYRTYLEIAREHRKIDDDKAVDALFHQKEPFVDLFVPKATVTKTFKAFLADAKYRDLRSGTLGDEIRATKSGIVVDYSMTEGRPLQSRSGNGLSATGSASNQVYQTRESQRCSDKNYDYDDDDEVDEDEDEDEEDSDTDACEEENDNLAIDTVEVFRRLSSPFGGWEETEEGGNVVARRVAYLAHFGRYQLLTLLTTTPIEFAIPYMWPLMYRYLTFENGFGVWPAVGFPQQQRRFKTTTD